MKLYSDATIAVGSGTPVILLHGLFGNLSNWEYVVNEFSPRYRILIPRLSMLEAIPGSSSSLNQLVDFLSGFIERLSGERVILIGNSLGGHLALLYALENPSRVKKLVLTGSSGLYERSFGGTFPRIKDYDYIKEKVSCTFFNKEVVTKELVDEVYSTIQHPERTMRILHLARAAQRENLADQLYKINTPTLLVWGLQDEITPPEVALEFHDRLPNSHIRFIDECGHVPMMEQPIAFNNHVRDFLSI